MRSRVARKKRAHLEHLAKSTGVLQDFARCALERLAHLASGGNDTSGACWRAKYRKIRVPSKTTTSGGIHYDNETTSDNAISLQSDTGTSIEEDQGETGQSFITT